MANDKEIVIDWLNNAYAMEKGLIPILQNHAKDAARHPAVRERVERHVEETRRHAEMVKDCLERMGEKPSTIKAAIGGVVGAVQSVAPGPFKNEEVRNALSDYATEHFEIAAYRALSEAARAIGDEETARTCEQICREEQEMANFLEQNLPNTVRDALGRER